MTINRFSLIDVLNRLDTEIDVQNGRVGLMQRWLDDQGTRIDALIARLAHTEARIDALLSAGPPPK